MSMSDSDFLLPVKNTIEHDLKLNRDSLVTGVDDKDVQVCSEMLSGKSNSEDTRMSEPEGSQSSISSMSIEGSQQPRSQQPEPLCERRANQRPKRKFRKRKLKDQDSGQENDTRAVSKKQCIKH